MNLVEILKNAPLPVTLYSTVFGELKLFIILPDEERPLHCATMDGSRIRTFSPEGKYHPDGECVLFPSKDNCNWKLFFPFKDGDILANDAGKPFIFKSFDLRSGNVHSYCGLDIYDVFHLESDEWTFACDCRLATKEEKQRLFDAIKANGYKWNAEEKKVEKLEELKWEPVEKSEGLKWNPNTLKPFDKVLMRNDTNGKWKTGLFSFYSEDPNSYPFCVGGFTYIYCVPFNEATAYLVGTTQTPPEYYRASIDRSSFVTR